MIKTVICTQAVQTLREGLEEVRNDPCEERELPVYRGSIENLLVNSF